MIRGSFAVVTLPRLADMKLVVTAAKFVWLNRFPTSDLRLPAFRVAVSSTVPVLPTLVSNIVG